jgi:signal transduction histidine kinase
VAHDSTSNAGQAEALRLLLVEDSDDDAELVAYRLRQAGIHFCLDRVETEPAFRRALRQPVDLIVADFMVPQFGAIAALEILRSENLDIPLIIISGTIGEETAVAAMRHGAVDYVLKDRLGRLPQAVLQGIDTARMRVGLREKRENLAQAHAHLEELSVQLIDAQEQERKSLARELHDELGQRLTAIKISLHRMRDGLNGADAEAAWDSADGEVAMLIAQVREMSVALRPPALDYLGLEAAIRQLLERQFTHTDITYALDYAGVPAALTPSIEITAYRIIQESITNIVRHAGASRVVVEVNGGESGEELELIVRDNGSGFDVAAQTTLQRRRMSSGLLGMSERVKLLGGIFTVEAARGQGTRIAASLPIKPSKNGTD